MPADSDFDLVLRDQLLCELDKRGISAAGASSLIGRGRNFLSRKLDGSQPLAAEVISQVCQVLGISAEEFIVSLLERMAPHRLKTSQLQTPLEVPPAFLAKILRRISSEPDLNDEERIFQRLEAAKRPVALECIEPVSDLFSLCVSAVERHPPTGYNLAREHILESLETTSRSQPDTLRLANLVNAWAIAARRTGQIQLAINLTCLGLELHDEANLSPTYPPLVRHAAVLCHELGERSKSIALAQHALLLSALVEDATGRARSALYLANIYLSFDFPTRSARILRVIKDVPPELAFSVLHTLAVLEYDLGNISEAERIHGQIQPGTRREGLHLDWLAARLSTARGCLTDATVMYSRLIDRSEDFLPPFQRLLLFVEMVPLLRKNSTPRQIQQIAMKLLPDLEKLELNNAARRLRDDVIAAATRGGLEHDFRLYRKLLLQES